jgi:hypothetical protein
LKGRVFQNEDELFAATAAGWNVIPQCVLDNPVGTFLARCRVCFEFDRECLNGHWRRVHHSKDPANAPKEAHEIVE